MSGITDDDSRITVAARRPTSDPPFKLFGQTIPIVSAKSHCFQDLGDEGHNSECQSSVQDEAGSSSGSNDGCDESDKAIEAASVKSQNPSLTAEDSGELVSSKVKNETSCEDEGGEEQELGEEGINGAVHVSVEQQTPKKPDKPVPCPRCQSLETKFCYYNNYNVNQPRHFCKNCQRYWTAGGTLRNVPVGSGRRKSKHGSASSHQRNGFSDGLLVRGDAPENAQQMLPCHGNSTALKGSGNVNRYSKTGINAPMDAHLAENTAPPRSTVLSCGQETSMCKTGNSMSVPIKSDVLQGYKPSVSMNAKMESGFMMAKSMNTKVETSLSMGQPMNGKVESSFSMPKKLNGKVESVYLMPKVESEVKQSKQFPVQNGIMKPPCTVPVMQSTDIKYVEPMQLHIPITTNIGSTNSSTSSEIHSGSNTDAGLPWGNNPQFPFVNAPWQYGWGNMAPASSFAQDSSAANSTNPSTTNMVAQPPWATLWSGIPWPLLQNPMLVPPAWSGAWQMPWAAAAAAPVTAAAAAAALAAASAASAGNQSLATPVLGKHPRDQAELEGEKGGKLLFPKTLRIGDPDEAAQSSIWTALGLARGSDMCVSGGMFSNMQSKDSANAISQEVQKSNPAAMRRSMAFQEGNVATQHVDVQGK